MDIKSLFVSQYNASLSMLKNVAIAADEEIWHHCTENNSPFWHILYHVLFCTDCYLSKDAKSFTVWEKHRKDYQFLGKTPFAPFNKPDISMPFTKIEILEYFEKILSTLNERVDEVDFESESGFYWIDLNKFELQIYNIRHIQHHTGQLAYMLRNNNDIGINWIVKGAEI